MHIHQIPILIKLIKNYYGNFSKNVITKLSHDFTWVIRKTVRYGKKFLKTDV